MTALREYHAHYSGRVKASVKDRVTKEVRDGGTGTENRSTNFHYGCGRRVFDTCTVHWTEENRNGDSFFQCPRIS